jgi:hypothetical protein
MSAEFAHDWLGKFKVPSISTDCIFICLSAVADFGALPDAAGKALHANHVCPFEERGRCLFALARTGAGVPYQRRRSALTIGMITSSGFSQTRECQTCGSVISGIARCP